MTHAILAHRIWPEASAKSSARSWVRPAVLALAGSFLVAAAAQIIVPMWPVPMTLQTLAVLAVGAAYGARLGAATLALYAFEGAIGLPFFAGGRGGIADAKLDYFLPAGSMGYVVGFVIAAWLVGKLVESGWANTVLKTILATALGAAALYIPGLVWLAFWASKTMDLDATAAMTSALSWGLYPFLVGDLLKAAIAGLAVPAAGAVFSRK